MGLYNSPDAAAPDPWRSLALGGCIGGAQLIGGAHPLDRIKVYQQANLGECISIRRAVREIYARSGWRGFYAGVGVAAPQFCLKNGFRWIAIQYADRVLHRTISPELHEQHPQIRSLGLGILVGGSEALLLICPSESLKTKAMTLSQDRGTFRFKASLYLQRHGFRRLFDGWDAVIARQIISLSSLYLGYQQGDCWIRYWRSKPPGHSLSTPEQFIAGGIAGIYNGIATIALDVIKTQLQKENPLGARSAPEALRKIVTTHGRRALATGLTIRMLRVAFVAGTEFSAMSACGVFDWHRTPRPSASTEQFS